MKSFCIVSLALVAVAAAAAYNSDAGINIDALLGDKNEVLKFVDCLTDKSECTPMYAGLKGDFSDALATACAKCTPEQKHNSKEFLKAIKKFFPEELKGLQDKYDADSKLFPALDEAIATY